MPDYGIQGLSELGAGIGALFEAEHKKRESVRQTQSILDTFVRMPSDPSDPKSKPLLSHKDYDALSNQLKIQGASAEAGIAAYLKMGQQTAMHGAVARYKTDEQDQKEAAELAREESIADYKHNLQSGKDTEEEKEISKESGKDKAAQSILENAVTDPAEVSYGRYATKSEIDQGIAPAPAAGQSGSFIPTTAGKDPQPIVRITSQSGKSFVMPREQYEKRKTRVASGGSDRVRVKSPDGRIGTVSRSQLKSALKSGYSQVSE